MPLHTLNKCSKVLWLNTVVDGGLDVNWYPASSRTSAPASSLLEGLVAGVIWPRILRLVNWLYSLSELAISLGEDSERQLNFV